MSKPWYRSTTMYALLVAITAKLLELFGVFEGDQATTAATELVTQILMVIAILADLVAARGRVVADGPLTLVKDERKLP